MNSKHIHVHAPLSGHAVEAAFRALGLHREADLKECRMVEIAPGGIVVTEHRKHVFGMGDNARMAERVTEFGIKWRNGFADDTAEHRMEVLRAFAAMAGFELSEWQEFVANWIHETVECVCFEDGVLCCPMHGPDALRSP
jgi:hypothetical protein